MTPAKSVVLGFGAALLLLPLWSGVAGAQGKSQAELRQPFIGTWRLVSIEGGARNASDEGMLDGGAVDFVRKFELTHGGNRIVLTPVSGGGAASAPLHLTWERVK